MRIRDNNNERNRMVENVSLQSYNNMIDYLVTDAFSGRAEVIQVEEEGRGYVIYSIAPTEDTTALAIIGTASETDLIDILRDFQLDVSDVRFEVWEILYDVKNGEDVTAVFAQQDKLERFDI